MKIAIRAGIVLSILWFVFGGLWAFLSQGWSGADYAIEQYKLCEQVHDMPGNLAQPDNCLASYDHNFEIVAGTTGVRVVWGVFAGLVPIPLVWGLAWLIVRTCRWVLYGRWKPKGNS